MFIAASLYLLATILFVVSGSGDLEQWAIIDEPLPEIPERQNDNSRVAPKRSGSVRRSPSKRSEEEAANQHRRGVSLKTGTNQKRPDGMEYLSVPPDSEGVVGTNDTKRKTSDSGENNSSKRRSGLNHGSHSTSVSPTHKTPPAMATAASNDNNEFFDTVPSL